MPWMRSSFSSQNIYEINSKPYFIVYNYLVLDLYSLIPDFLAIREQWINLHEL